MVVAEDIRTVDDLQRDPKRLLDTVNQTRRPMVITMNGKPAAILLSPELFPTKKIALTAACELTEPGV